MSAAFGKQPARLSTVQDLRQRWQVVILLGIGMLSGICATLGLQLAFVPPRAITATAASSPQIKLKSLLPTADPPDATTLPPMLPGRGKNQAASSAMDWERVAAQFAAPGGDPSLARSQMLRLDEKALRKLAANVAAWPRSRRNGRILGEIFHRWGELDPQEALAQAQTLPVELARTAFRETLDGYAESDPPAACAYLAAPSVPGGSPGLHNDFSREIRLGMALQTWAEQDAAGAVAFASRLPAGSYLPYVVGNVAGEWTRQDPQAALNWAQGLGGPQRNAALNGVMDTWSETDPQAAANFVLGLSGDSNQAQLVKTLVNNWALQDPAAAASWATGQSGSLQAQAVAAVVEGWTYTDPAAAAAWTAQLAAGDTRNAAWGALGKEWYVEDAAAARNWINSLPTGAGRDAAIAGSSEFWVLRDRPAEMLGLVNSISDPQVREATLTSVLNKWLERDNSAAQQWISQASLPAAVASKLNGG